MNFSEFSHGKFEMVFIVAWLSRLKYTFDGPTLCLTKCPFPWSLEEQGSTGVKWDSLSAFIAGYRRPIRPALARNAIFALSLKKPVIKLQGFGRKLPPGQRMSAGPMSNCQEESLILPFRGVGH